jgi:hypothetical protein
MIFNEIPEQPYKFLMDRILSLRESLRTETFEGPDGELRWKSNPTSVIALDVFRDAYVTPPVSQQAAYDKHLGWFLAAYREARKNYVPSAEERYEMRAAFGPGEEVVDVITGQRFTT